jgi:hypothetical protein
MKVIGVKTGTFGTLSMRTLLKNRNKYKHDILFQYELIWTFVAIVQVIFSRYICQLELKLAQISIY